jgi:RHS repeat-associated protein
VRPTPNTSSSTPAAPPRSRSTSARAAGYVADAIRITREVDAGNVAYIHTDQLGQPHKLTDASKAVVWDRVARPFGATAAETGTTAVALRFPGQWADAESGYHYNYFRDYDPSIGRYLQSDPIGIEGGRNTYGYVGANPQNLIDPHGLSGSSLDERWPRPLRGPGAAAMPGTPENDELRRNTGNAILWCVRQVQQAADTLQDLIHMATSGGKEHTKGQRPSTREKHEKGKSAKDKSRGGEKADEERRPNRKRPVDWKGPWPQKR